MAGAQPTPIWASEKHAHLTKPKEWTKRHRGQQKARLYFNDSPARPGAWWSGTPRVQPVFYALGRGPHWLSTWVHVFRGIT